VPQKLRKINRLLNPFQSNGQFFSPDRVSEASDISEPLPG